IGAEMIPQLLISGLVVSACYGLFALGFTLIFGVLRVINLLYGFYFWVGAMASLLAVKLLGLPFYLAFPLGALVAGVIAVALDGAILTPLRRARADELSSLMVTLGAVLALYAAASLTFGAEVRRLPFAVLPEWAWQVGALRITLSQILIVGSTLLLGAMVWLGLRYSQLGLALRAMTENPTVTQLMGINIGWAAAVASFLSGLLGGAAGILIGLNYNAIHPFMGENMMLKGFAAVIMGGLGNVQGAILAGLVLGYGEVFAATYISSGYKDAVAFCGLIATLLLRPNGLFGSPPAHRS
ncbi:MAG: branched-chain amino acid ABC transporter permease, partial [Alphaproteobacteria bacterium]|nr:branched-chain amino acid ABC transporter permease [Alphaproteobacteria bacterium]